MKRVLDVYNLEFRDYCHEMDIFGYRFRRVKDYGERLRTLQHRVHCHSEFDVPMNTGTHAVTARVEFDSPQQSSVIRWSGAAATALEDITLLLSLATTRSVFAVELDEEDDREWIITSDPREYMWGGLFALSLPYSPVPRSDHPEFEFDASLELYVNSMYERMRSAGWRGTYRDGHFLLLFKWAMQQPIVDSAFIQCWTIWEHLFAILNERWMTRQQIEKMSAYEKVGFILVHFAIRDRLDDKQKARLQTLAHIRNRLIHFGMFPEGSEVHKDAVTFVRMTEFVVARILGLTPPDTFNTLAEFETFLARKS